MIVREAEGAPMQAIIILCAFVARRAEIAEFK